MSQRPILLHPDPRLRKPAEPVGIITPELQRLADDMLETMYAAPGIGLAAPQVGVSKRLLVMDCEKDESKPRQPMILFNPQLVWSSEEMNIHEEGCLSIPEQYAEVTRPAEVEVSWLDRDGKERRQRFDGLWATCVQHEMDHLDGKLFIDYLTALKRQLITRKMQKLKREKARA